MKKIWIQFLMVATVIIISFLIFSNLESFFSELLNGLSKKPFAYAAVSFVVLTSDIVLPVPSSIVMYVNGYVLGVIFGSIISLLSLIVSAMIGYYLGKITSSVLKTTTEMNSQKFLNKYGAVAVLLTRGIPILSESVCFVSGYNKLPFKKYVLYNIVGYIPLCILYAYCGSLGYDKNIFLLSFGCSLIIAASFWFLGKSVLKSE